MRVPRDHLAAGVVGEKIYAIGGRLQHSFGSNLNVNEEYAPVSDTWTTRAPLPITRSGVAAAVLGGRVYVFGGEAPSGTFGTAEAYDPATNSWAEVAPMPTARHGLGAAVLQGTIYVIGGGLSPGSTDGRANEAFTP